MDKINKRSIPKEREFICKMCGNTFKSTATHASYCKYCRDKRQLERSKEHYQKMLENKIRRLGSEQICPECGNTYILRSGTQKMCEDCANKHSMQLKKEANRNYSKRRYDSFLMYFPKGKKKELQDYAKEHKMSFNEFINTCIDYYIKNHKD